MNRKKYGLADRLYIFMDDLSYNLSKKDWEILDSLKSHIIATSVSEQEYFSKIPVEHLSEQECVDLFYGYFWTMLENSDKKRWFENAVRDIVAYAHYHTSTIVLLAKSAARTAHI